MTVWAETKRLPCKHSVKLRCAHILFPVDKRRSVTSAHVLTRSSGCFISDMSSPKWPEGKLTFQSNGYLVKLGNENLPPSGIEAHKMQRTKSQGQEENLLVSWGKKCAAALLNLFRVSWIQVDWLSLKQPLNSVLAKGTDTILHSSRRTIHLEHKLNLLQPGDHSLWSAILAWRQGKINGFYNLQLFEK